MKRQPIHDHPPVYAESAASATFQTVQGWVSRTGQFYGRDEDLARRHGSTVALCRNDPSHGAVENRGYCEVCTALSAEARWEKMEKMRDGVFAGLTPSASFFLFDSDEFFRDASEVWDYAADNDLDELRLVLAKPLYLSIPDAGDFFAGDDMPEEWELPEAAYSIIDEANEKLRALGIQAYEPGKLGYLWKRST